MRDLLRDLDDARERQRVLGAQHLRQRLALDERHRQVLDAVDLAEVVNADDVLVRDLARQHELALEARLELLRRRRVRLRAGANHLDRDGDAELVIERLIDGAHAADAEQLQDRVARTDLLAGLERSVAGAGGGRGDGLSSDVATPVGPIVAESMGSALRAGVAMVCAVGAWTAPVGIPVGVVGGTGVVAEPGIDPRPAAQTEIGPRRDRAPALGTRRVRGGAVHQ